MLVRLLGVALLLLSTAMLGAQSADTVRLRATSPCERCISLTQVAVLTLPDTLGGFISPYIFERARNGDYFVLDPFGPLGIHRFDANGGYSQTIGTRGGGPGEFTFIESFTLDAHDTLRVFGSNHAVFTTSGAHVRSRRLDDLLRPTRTAGLGDGRMVVVGLSPAAEKRGIPMHLVRPDGSIERSFGAQPGSAARSGLWDRRQSLAIGSTSSFFTAFSNRYAIEEWSVDGTRRRVLERVADWFPPWNEWGGTADVERPPSRVAHLMVDGRGLLWVITIVADARWKPSGPPAGERRMRSMTEIGEQFDTIIEVVDLARAEVVASQRLPGVVVGAFGSNHLALTVEDSDGSTLVTIWRAAFRTTR